MTMTIHDQVKNFHLAMGEPVLDRPTIPPDDRVRLRARVLLEEVMETVAAMFDVTGDTFEAHAARDTFEAAGHALEILISQAPVKIDMVELADGLADCDYLTEGARLEFGIYGEDIARVVHESNMRKCGGPKREDGKRMKPPGWQPPAIAAELRAQTVRAEVADAQRRLRTDLVGEHMTRSTTEAGK